MDQISFRSLDKILHAILSKRRTPSRPLLTRGNVVERSRVANMRENLIKLTDIHLRLRLQTWYANNTLDYTS